MKRFYLVFTGLHLFLDAISYRLKRGAFFLEEGDTEQAMEDFEMALRYLEYIRNEADDDFEWYAIELD